MNYSLLIMESVGMMKMATGEGFPFQQGAGMGLDLFSVATEVCGDVTPHLGYFLEVSLFIGIFGVRNKSGGPQVVHKIGRHARGGRGPPHPRGRPGTLLAQLFYSGVFFWSKKISKIGTSIGLRLVFLFCKTQKQGKTETGTGL